MATEKIINAVKRDSNGSANARRLRVSGKIPAVVYGDIENTPIAVDAHSFWLMVRDFGHNFVGDLVIDDAPVQKVLLKDLQYSPAKGDILHADFVAISMTDKLDVSLPIVMVGDAPGAIAGGIVEQILGELQIECLPDDMVENIVVDISELEIGDSISVADLKLPKGVVNLTDGALAVVSVAAPRVGDDEDADEDETVVAEGDKEATEEKTEA